MRLNLGQFDADFWRYVGSFAVFSVGVYVFAELYPLVLQEAGHGVVVVGDASLALNLGSIAGVIPALFLVRLVGLAATNAACIAGVALASAARLWHTHPAMIYGGAFAAGFFFAVLTVCIAVIVSRLTTPANRALAFSWFFGLTIAAGFVGDTIGGELPDWMAALAPVAHPKLAAALLACGLSLVAAALALGLRIPGAASGHERLRFPRDRPTLRLLLAVGGWNFAVGLFAPFYVTYFSTYLGASVREIGLDLASGQVVGAIFTIFVPMWIAGWGAVRSVRFMMFTAGTSAFFLSLVASPWAVGVGYAAYMGYVAMAQPAMQTMLMNQVRPEEQAGTSMINSLVTFSAVAAGGFAGGRLIEVLGYPPMLALAGAACMLAAVVFVVMVRGVPDPVPRRAALPAPAQ